MNMRFLFLCITTLLVIVISTTHAQENDISSMLAAGTETVVLDSLLLDEPFDADDAWERFSNGLVDLRVEDGAYRIDVVGSGVIWGLQEHLIHTDIVINVEATLNSGAATYGVMCRADPSNNGEGYYFLIDSEGTAEITLRNRVLISDVVTSDAIHAGEASNQITAVCQGSYLALYVNDVLVIEATDDTYVSGYAGLAAQANDTSAAQVSFDNVMIWATSTADSTLLSHKPQQLEYYNAADWREIVDELEANRLIAYGGSLMFNEEQAFFAGQGDWYTVYARSTRIANIVMAGELTFSPSDAKKFEVCNLSSRVGILDSGSIVTFLDIGLLDTGDLMVVDRFNEVDDPIVEFALLGLDLSQPHHILYIVQDEWLTVYVDGELVIDDFEVSNRAGVFGISLEEYGSDVRCEMNNVWGYQVPQFNEGVCEAYTNDNIVNLREGPGTGFAVPGQLEAASIVGVIGQTMGADGFAWWQLAGGNWVRDDVVNVVGDCVGIPEAN